MNKHTDTPINCSKCGRFVGKDGFLDTGYDCEGTPEFGYPLCKRCLDIKVAAELKANKDAPVKDFEAVCEELEI